jgi:hypothetical protein
MFDSTGITLSREAPELADGPDLSDLPLELIEREIEELATRITAGNARWLELVAEFDRREGWGDTGCRSTCEWVAWRCALTPRTAREQVRVARALRELPLIREAFSAGELSYSKVRALTRVADRESEADLLELARLATAAQLERMVRAARRVTAAEAAEAQGACFVRWSWNDDDGCLDVHAKLAPDEGALFIEALGAARATLTERRREEAADERGSAEPPPGEPPAPTPTNAECLSAIAEVALARPPSGFNGLAGGERYQVLVHIDASTLATDSPGPSHLAGGPGISPEVARRIACDASLVPLVELEGMPVAIGHAKRTIPASIRRALIARDGHCQFPGCEHQRFVDAHHLEHWAHGGQTTLENLALLCRRHHRLLHEFGYSVYRDGDGRLRFFDPGGFEIPSSPSPPLSGTARLPRARGKLLAGIGEKMDLRLCVDAVLRAMLGPLPTARAAPAAGAPG